MQRKAAAPSTELRETKPHVGRGVTEMGYRWLLMTRLTRNYSDGGKSLGPAPRRRPFGAGRTAAGLPACRDPGAVTP